MHMTGIVTGNANQAGVGLLLREAPRHFSIAHGPIKLRVRNAIQLAVARHNDSSFGPAYARVIAIAGNNFLSNMWRVFRVKPTRTTQSFLGDVWQPMASRNFGRM